MVEYLVTYITIQLCQIYGNININEKLFINTANVVRVKILRLNFIKCYKG